MVVDTILGTVMALATALPLAWKWELGVRRAALAMLLACATCGLMVAAAKPALPAAVPEFLAVYALSLALAAAFLLYRFYRDPERLAPGDVDAVLSPADGRVIYVRASADGRLPVSGRTVASTRSRS